jgi:hypothetical protein
MPGERLSSRRSVCRLRDSQLIPGRQWPALARHCKATFHGSIHPVKSDDAIQELDTLLTELNELRPDAHSTEFISWDLRARSAFTRAFGEQHYITRRFIDTDWTLFTDDSAANARWFRETVVRVRGLFDAATAEVSLLGDDVPVADESGIDPELWEHVAPEIRSEAWVKVARGAVIFAEDRIRKWAGRPAEEVGKDLAVAVFGANGNYRMGLTDGEKQGWQLLAQGIARALRNADTHRIQNRSDHKRYALGVVGACSLLLTQMRYEHGNRFQDTSPARAVEGDGDESRARMEPR